MAGIYEKNIPDWYHHYYQLIKQYDDKQANIIEQWQLIFIELPKKIFHSISAGDKAELIMVTIIT